MKRFTFFLSFICSCAQFQSASLAQIHISGPLSGVLEDTTYIVEGDIWVEEGDSLNIEPGVKLKFQSFTSFDIYGYLGAIGTAQDTIYFLKYDSIFSWYGITIYEEADSCILIYCRIDSSYSHSIYEFGNLNISNCLFYGSYGMGVNCHNSIITISDCLFENNSGSAIFLLNTTAEITNCDIRNNSAECGGGIYTSSSNVNIKDCFIFDNFAYAGAGIAANNSSNANISNCIIIENKTEDFEQSFGGGAMIFNSEVEFSNCVFSKNEADWVVWPGYSGPQGGGIFAEGSEVTINNCVFYDNRTYSGDGDAINLENSNLIIINSIVDSCRYSESLYIDSFSSVDIIYNCFFGNWCNFSGNLPSSLGVLNSVNINGDSCDIYHNIFLDPMFVNPDSDDFNLQWNSPCIDAGDPESPLDPDSTIADIGAFYYDQTQGVENPIFSLSTLAFSLITYPNPFNADSQIRFSLPEASLVELKIYDVLGREIAILVDQTLAPGMHTVIFHGENLSSGIYFCSLRANNYHTIKKLILVK